MSNDHNSDLKPKRNPTENTKKNDETDKTNENDSLIVKIIAWVIIGIIVWFVGRWIIGLISSMIASLIGWVENVVSTILTTIEAIFFIAVSYLILFGTKESRREEREKEKIKAQQEKEYRSNQTANTMGGSSYDDVHSEHVYDPVDHVYRDVTVDSSGNATDGWGRNGSIRDHEFHR